MKTILALFLLSSFALSQVFTDPGGHPGAREWSPGVNVLPIANKPFSAKVKLEIVKTTQDGVTITRRTWRNTARDAAGRTHTEMRAPIFGDDSAPVLLNYTILDPTTNTRYRITPSTQKVERFPIGPGVSQPPSLQDLPKGVTLSKVDLGEKSVDGLPTHGTRETRTYDAGVVGNDRAFDVVDEYWYSPDLEMNLSINHNDPRLGIETIQVTELSRAEPDPSLFRVPGDAKPAEGTTANAGPIYHIGSGVTPPHPTYSPDPSYTDRARKAKVSGKVILAIVVQPDGSVSNVEVKQSLDPSLNESAINAVRTWHFQPAMKDGKPVAVQINVEVNFRVQ